jgi:hypothetical protein
VIRLDKLYRVPRWAFAVRVLTGRVVTPAELEAHAEQVLHQLTGPSHTFLTPAPGESEAVSRRRSAGRRAGGGRVRRSSGLGRSGSVEQLQLLPED